MDSKASPQRPEEELAAWNAWKKICFVDGCPPEQRSYLRRRIIAKMTHELRKYGIDTGRDHWLSDDELVSEFDLFLACKDGASPEGGGSESGRVANGLSRRQFKQHKDYIWNKLQGSKDPPMQVLNGILLGPRSIIMDVLRKVLRSHYSTREVRLIDRNTGTKVRRLQRLKSLQEPLEGADGRSDTLEERLADKQPTPDALAGENSAELKITLQLLVQTLSREERLVLLAKLLRINASAPSVSRVLGRGKSTVCALLRQVQEKVQHWYQTSEDIPKCVTVEMHQIFCDLLVAGLQQETSPAIQDFLRQVWEIRSDAR
ncbi:MAG: hypothetical protein WCT05_05140 [Lentisphaeria bacterium]